MRTVLPLVLLLALGVAACGGGSGGAGGAASQGACPKGALVIHMRNIQFAPQTASAKVGEKVCWVNDDDVQHDAQADDGAFKSPLFGKGETFSTTLEKAGAVAYVCSVHPNMTATLKVKP